MGKEPSYYAIVPARVRYNPKLSANAKLMFGEITALCDKEGHCWAKNRYFAKLYGVTSNTVSLWIGQLQAAGEIVVKVDAKRGNEREIRLAESMPKLNRESYPEKSGDPSPEKQGEFNSTRMNTLEEEVLKAWNGSEFRKAVALTKQRRRHLQARLREPFFIQNFKAAITAASRSAFLKGENKRGWIANFDWFLRPGTVPRIMEGIYGSEKTKAKAALDAEEFAAD